MPQRLSSSPLEEGENMPSAGSIAVPEKPSIRGIFSLILTVLLCFPSLLGGTALLINSMIYRDAEEWGRVSGAMAAMGGIFGRPLVALAAVVGATVVFRKNVPPKIIYAHLLVVVLGMIATLVYLFRLGY